MAEGHNPHKTVYHLEVFVSTERVLNHRIKVKHPLGYDCPDEGKKITLSILAAGLKMAEGIAINTLCNKNCGANFELDKTPF